MQYLVNATTVFLLGKLPLVTIAARVLVGGFSIGEKKPAVQAGSFQFLNTLTGEMIMKQRESNINIPLSTNWRQYEALKKEITETASSHQEYERRVMELSKRMGV